MNYDLNTSQYLCPSLKSTILISKSVHYNPKPHLSNNIIDYYMSNIISL